MTRQEFLKTIRQNYNPSLVRISESGVNKLELGEVKAALLPAHLPFDIPATATGPALDSLLDAGIFYLLAQTSLQYRFWWKGAAPAPERYKFDGMTGSMGMTRAFDTAWGTGFRPSAAVISAAGNIETMKSVFGETFPDPASRCAILTEVLLNGTHVASELRMRIQRDGGIDISHAAFLASQLPYAYHDVFLKKAMLAVAFAGSLLNRFSPVEDRLCAFADYQVPRVLRHFGVLEYSDELADMVARGALLDRDGAEEIAIRAATVLACEDVAEAKGVTAAGIDWWCFQQRNLPTAPFHLTETTSY